MESYVCVFVCPQYPVLNTCMWKVVCARGSTSRAKDGQTRCWSRRGGAEQGHACWLSCPLNPSAFSLVSFSFRTLSTSCTHWVVCVSVCFTSTYTAARVTCACEDVFMSGVCSVVLVDRDLFTEWLLTIRLEEWAV